MKRAFTYFICILAFLFATEMVSGSDTVISNKLQELRVTRQSFLPVATQTGASAQPVKISKSGYLVLELSGTVTYDALTVFANDFLLMSETVDGYKHSTTAKFIGLPNEPIQTSIPKPIAEMGDYVRVESGKVRFWAVFYLPFHTTPVSLHYFGSWPITYRVPFRFAPEIKAAKVLACPP